MTLKNKMDSHIIEVRNGLIKTKDVSYVLTVEVQIKYIQQEIRLDDLMPEFFIMRIDFSTS